MAVKQANNYMTSIIKQINKSKTFGLGDPSDQSYDARDPAFLNFPLTTSVPT